MSLIRELHRQLTQKERSAVEITQSYLDRIQALEPTIHSFLTVTETAAIAQAQRVDQKIANGDDIGLLEGIPIGLKDNLCTKGVRTACASKVSVTGNPWNPDCVPGGSSGGSAAAVAADECPIALGSDTGGSIRQPAALCGVVGLKPTYGLVSRYGLVAFASSLDQIGPLSRTVEDAAILLQAIAGHDPKDSTSLQVEIPDYTQNLKPGLDCQGRTIGIIQETFGEGLEPAVNAAVKAAIAQYESLGATVKTISLPRFRYGLPSYYIIAPSEASSNLARYDGVKYGARAEEGNLVSMYTKTRAAGFGAEVKRRIMIGTYALSAGYYDAYYLKAQKVRTLIKQDFEAAFKEVDALICPTSPTTAFTTGSKVEDPLSMYLLDLMTIPVNLAGLPGISLPCGFDASGLPIGLQLIGNVLQEQNLFEMAYAYEQTTDWHTKSPNLAH